MTGIIIDKHHPLVGKSVTGKILAIPSGRGSCTGSAVMLELLLNGTNPKALVFGREELILAIGVLVAQEMFQKSIPILQVPMTSFDRILQLNHVAIYDGQIQWGDSFKLPSTKLSSQSLLRDSTLSVQLSALDQELLNGSHGKAAQTAMRVIIQTAQLEGVSELIDVKQAHIDCCGYTGPGILRFAQQLVEWDAKARIPTSLNAISVDRRLWRSQGVDPALGEPSEALAQAYLDMDARPTFTCAPYLLDSAPEPGDHIMWAESNAVVFANSVLGARTIKCPDLLDVCVALTGRAPNTGCHITENRKARLEIHYEAVEDWDDTLFPLLGYIVGDITGERVPIVTGLEKQKEKVTIEDLKAFGAAFATTSSAPMFHIAGITMEASTAADIKTQLSNTFKTTIKPSDLARQWCRFNACEENETHTPIDLVSLGSPHFSYDEIVTLASLVKGRKKSKNLTLVITCNRDAYSKACKKGYTSVVEEFGAQILTDTCWCMVQEPVVPAHARTILTNSAKYAHYGPGLTGRQVRFGGLSDCVNAACEGHATNSVPAWLCSTNSA